jgi:hypothetical protein
MCCSFVIPFFVFGLRVFFNSPTQFLPMTGIEWCAALLWFLSLRLVLEYFSTVLQFLPISRELSDVLLFCDSFLVFGLGIFQQSYPFLPMKAGIEWCAALLWFPFFVFGLKSIFQQSYPILPMKAGIEWCAALVIPFFVFGLRYFSTVLQFPPMKAGIEWCAALSFCFCVWS